MTMAKYEYRKDLEGYDAIVKEMEIYRKYGIDYRLDKGAVAATVARLHPRKLTLKVSEIHQETPTTITLRLVSVEGCLPPFQAGQYISLAVEIDGIRTSRPYSLSSSPHQTGFYDVTVRRKEEGFVSSYLLDRARVGDVFEASGPAGNFYYNPLFHGSDLVFLAGGSGITPFASMIREATDRGLDRRMHLIYGCSDAKDIIFDEEFKQRAKLHPNFNYSLVISDPPVGYSGLTGFITADLIQREVAGPLDKKTFYICGPEAMYAFCLPELDKLGLPRRRVRKEIYGPPAAVAADAAWPGDISPDARFFVRLRSRGTIDAKASEPLLASLERHHIAVPNSCRSGECSLCRIKLLSGRVFHSQGALIRKSDERFGYIHACAAYPLSDLELLL